MWCVKFAINIKMCSGAIRVQLGIEVQLTCKLRLKIYYF